MLQRKQERLQRRSTQTISTLEDLDQTGHKLVERGRLVAALEDISASIESHRGPTEDMQQEMEAIYNATWHMQEVKTGTVRCNPVCMHANQRAAGRGHELLHA